MRADRPLVLFRAADAVLGTQVLSGFDHPAGHGEASAARVATRLGKPVEQLGLTPLVPSHTGDVVLGLAHAFRAARQHELRAAGGHLHTGVDHGLQPRSATPVDLQARNGDVQARVQGGDPADGRCLPVGVALAEDHVVDGVGGDAGAVDEALDHRGGEVGDRYVPEHAPIAPDRGTDRLTDDGLEH